MKHNNKNKYHKTEKTEPVAQSKEFNTPMIERHLEPTVNEPETEKQFQPAMPTVKAEIKPIKEMNAEIASISVELSKKSQLPKPIKETPSLVVPVSIVLAGICIAGAILYTGSRTPAVPKSAEYQSVASQLTKGTIAEEVGLDKKKFDACLASGKYTTAIKAISDAGAKAGITGTPFSVIVTNSGKKFVINGALPIDRVKAMIDSALAGSPADATNIDIPPITEKDRLYGNPNAEIKIVEYSDTECPFCKQFDATLNAIMAQYKDGGKVAWIYRYFPLDGLHLKARHEAEALECAFEIGGNDKFWEYKTEIFKVTPGNDGLDPALL